MMLGLLGIIACLSSPPIQPAPTPAVEIPAQTPPDNPADLESCVQACLRQNMARAVSADVIQQDCANACSTDAKGTPSLLEN